MNTNRENSRDLYDRALDVLPGGVNSPVRATRPYPFFVERGDGAHVIDADGNKYVDYVMGYGPILLGHDLPEPVISAVQSQLSDGPLFGAPTEVEVDLAEFVARHVPSVEMLRFVNSGTEATVSAVRLARGYTDRSKIVVMQGGYHGAQESTLVSGPAKRPAAPSSSGVPAAFAAETIQVPFNDEEAIREVFAEYGDDIAAVITEPILGNHGIVHPIEGYHETLREITEEHGALLIFDEVITGFRVGGLRCAQGKFGVTPDLTTFGKVVGGGFPVGALGGRTDLMEHLSPSGNVFQAGTFSGHPVTMTAGLEVLKYAAKHDVYDRVGDLADTLRAGLSDIVEDRAPAYTVAGTDSVFKVIFTREGAGEPRNGADVDRAATGRWERLFRPAMVDRGVALTANQFEAQFVSNAHTQADVEETLEAYKDVL